MSRFSGKCDFCDEIEIHGLDRVLNGDVYVGDNDEPLELKSIEDCVPYYPYIVVAAVHNNLTNKCSITLSSRSWVDIEEERYGHMQMHDVYRKDLQNEIQRVRSLRSGKEVS